MTPKARKALLWGGAFLLAFASGSVLGSFTVSGLAGDDRSLPDSSDVRKFWAEQDRARANGSDTQDVAASIADQAHGNHVCDGCDAGETRGRLRLGNLAASYSGASDTSGPPSAALPQDSAPAPAASAAGH